MRTRKNFNCNDIEKMLKSDIDKTHLRRLQAVLMWSQGSSASEIQQITGFKLSTVQHFCTRYRRGGAQALKTNYEGGNFRKLSFEEEAAALETCKELASKGGYVRVAELQAEFEKAAGVHYHPHVFYRLLERHGWRKVKPRGRHPKKASDEAIEASKKLT